LLGEAGLAFVLSLGLDNQEKGQQGDHQQSRSMTKHNQRDLSFAGVLGV
jgi:hypothetical protein